MHITIENNKVIVQLDAEEVPAFQAMFARQQEKTGVDVEFREFGVGSCYSSRASEARAFQSWSSVTRKAISNGLY